MLNCRCAEGPSGVKKMRYAVQFVTGRMELVGKVQKPGKLTDLDTHSVNVVGEGGFSGEQGDSFGIASNLISKI